MIICLWGYFPRRPLRCETVLLSDRCAAGSETCENMRIEPECGNHRIVFRQKQKGLNKQEIAHCTLFIEGKPLRCEMRDRFTVGSLCCQKRERIQLAIIRDQLSIDC